MTNQLSIRAHAKINLGLAVLGLRPDGYHDLCTVMQSIGLYDTLFLKRTLQEGLTLHLEADSPLPADEGNLAYRGARLVLEAIQKKAEESFRQGRPLKAKGEGGIELTLKKQIPMAAGMAGGSTDGAAAMVGVNTLLGNVLTREELLDLGKHLGADVPFCIQGGTVLCEGIGERMTLLPPLPDCFLLIAKPQVSVSTKEAYGSLPPLEERPALPMEQVIGAIQRSSLREMAPYLANSFQPGICKLHPVVEELLLALAQEGALSCCMSGSGPTVFGIFEKEEKALEAREHLLPRFSRCFLAVTRPVKQSLVLSDLGEGH